MAGNYGSFQGLEFKVEVSSLFEDRSCISFYADMTGS